MVLGARLVCSQAGDVSPVCPMHQVGVETLVLAVWLCGPQPGLCDGTVGTGLPQARLLQQLGPTGPWPVFSSQRGRRQSQVWKTPLPRSVRLLPAPMERAAGPRTRSSSPSLARARLARLQGLASRAGHWK